MTDQVNFETPTPAAGATNFDAGGGTPAVHDDKAVIYEEAGRKFTLAELVKARQHQNTHISTLEAERAEDRRLLKAAADALEKAPKANDVLDAAAKAQKEAQERAAAEAAAKGVSLTPEQIAAKAAEIVASQNAQATSKAKQDANWLDVTSALTKVYGTNVNDKVKAVAAEVGMTIEAAAQMARTTPEAFKRLFPELQQAPGRAAFNHGSGHSQFQRNAKPDGKKGFAAGKTSKERVTNYLAELERRAKA